MAKTLKKIHISIILSMMINAVAIICSILGLLNPITGALVHNIGSCAVVLLAASLYNKDFSDYIKKSQAEPIKEKQYYKAKLAKPVI